MENKKMNSLIYKIVRPIVKILFYVLFRPTVVGIDNIPKHGSYVLAGNHTKWLDPVMLIAVSGKNPVHFLAKEELFHGFSSFIVRAMGCIPVNRKVRDKNVLVNAYKYLNDGGVIGVFPEGTINRTNDIIMPFKMGAVKMCSETNSLLVPFVITGEYKLFRRGVVIEFLKPREIGKDLVEENEKFMKCVRKRLEDLGKGKN